MPRTFLAFACLLMGASAAAQNGVAPANVVTPAPAPREGTVGPEQLRDFALPGTRTSEPRTAQPAPATTPPAAEQVPAPAAPRAQPTAPRTGTGGERPVAQPVARAGKEGGPPQAPADEGVEPGFSAAVPTVAEPAPLPLPALPEPPLSAPVETADERTALIPAWWPWLLVAALAGVALALLLRQRQRRRLAATDGGGAFALAPQPQPEPSAPSAPSAPARPEGLVTTRLRTAAPPPLRAPAEAALLPAVPSPSAPAGAVVSRRLRAWIDLDLVLREILLDEAEAVLRFDLVVANGGAGPARTVVIEAVAISASEAQSEEIARFFDRPAAAEAAIAELAPMGQMTISHEIRLPRGAIRAYEAQGRTLFVPVLAFTASYRSAGGEGRTGAAFLAGRQVPGSDRLAPLPLGPGPARLLGLGVRRLDEALRR